MKNNLIFIQWDSYFGGLEKISQLFEDRFSDYNPLVAILRPTKQGFTYKNSFVFKEKNSLSFIYKYFLFVRRRKDSIIHIQYAGTTVLLVTFLAGARKILYHFHGTQFPNRIKDRFVWRLLEKKIVVIVNSIHTGNVIKEKIKLRNQFQIIPNLIDLKKFKYFERVYNGNKFLITYAGRFDKGKNINSILDTAKALTYDKQIEFLLVGDGPEKVNIEKKIKEYRLETIVKIIPYTNEILEIYYRSNLFIFTSLHESFGNVVAEAILTGLPVLCYKIHALEELINDDTFFIENQNPQLIAQKIVEFKENYSLINERLKKVCNYLNVYLDNEVIISKLNFLYKSFNN